jgi:hypothetical protein
LLPSHCSWFITRIKVLFVDGKALSMGYTAAALENIKNVILWWGAGGQPCRVGDANGASQDLMVECLRHMCTWTKLAVVIVEHEFPHFELIQSFMVLDLSGSQDH